MPWRLLTFRRIRPVSVSMYAVKQSLQETGGSWVYETSSIPYFLEKSAHRWRGCQPYTLATLYHKRISAAYLCCYIKCMLSYVVIRCPETRSSTRSKQSNVEFHVMRSSLSRGMLSLAFTTVDLSLHRQPFYSQVMHVWCFNVSTSHLCFSHFSCALF